MYSELCIDCVNTLLAVNSYMFVTHSYGLVVRRPIGCKRQCGVCYIVICRFVEFVSTNNDALFIT